MSAITHKKEDDFNWTVSEFFLFSLIGLGAIAVISIFVELLINLFREKGSQFLNFLPVNQQQFRMLINQNLSDSRLSS